MSKADKKQRHRAKREKKKLAARRFMAISPLKRLADAPGELECWRSGRLNVERQVQFFCYKRAGGLAGLACFLIDRGVVGLKDTWSRINIERAEFDGIIKRCVEVGVPATRTTVDDVRRTVAGAVRWTHENKMRLPKDWLKVVQVIGGVGDWASADVSEFIMEFAGHPEDLRQRLLGEPFESYINRGDVAFTFSENAPYMDQETGEYGQHDLEFDEDEFEAALEETSKSPEFQEFDQNLRRLSDGLAHETEAWLRAREQTPSPSLEKGWRLAITSYWTVLSKLPDADSETQRQEFQRKIGILLDALDDEQQDDLEFAVEQLLSHLSADPTLMSKAMSLLTLQLPESNDE